MFYSNGSPVAHITHGITKAVIFDIDLHHGLGPISSFADHETDFYYAGNGTQSIAWQINEETYRAELEQLEAQKSEELQQKQPAKPGLKVYYSSIHDILSYPCEVRFIFDFN